jgi:hypothetical protein
LLGSKTVKVVSPNPKGHVDVLSSTTAGKLRVKGWTFDPNAKTKSNSVRVYVGGPAGKGHRVDLGVAKLARSDVATANSGVGKSHGFDQTKMVKWRGKRTVYVYGLNLGGTPGAKSRIGKATITIR